MAVTALRRHFIGLAMLCSSVLAGTPVWAEEADIPRQGGTLHIALTNETDSWNPQKAVQTASYQVFTQVYGTLLRTSPDGRDLGPGLAQSYSYDESKSHLTFKLSPKATFSNGTAVTSADVKFSYSLWAGDSLYAQYYSSIKSVETPDPSTVVFILSAPDVTLLNILASANAAIVPKDFGGLSAADFWQRPISAGPFVIDAESKGQTISLKRNPHYYEPGLPYLDGIEYLVVPDENQRLLQYQNGDIDIVNSVDVGAAAQYGPDATVSALSATVNFLLIQAGSGPLADVRLRKAATLAIKHADLVAGGYSGQAQQAVSVIPQVVTGARTCGECDWGRTDLDEAKRLVAEAGYKGQPLSLAAPSDAGPELLAAQAIKPMLEAAGFSINIEAAPSLVLADRLEKGDFQMVVLNVSSQANTPSDMLGFIVSTGYLYTRADTAKAVAALQAIQSADDRGKVEAASMAFEADAYATHSTVPLAALNDIYAVSARVRGFQAPVFATYVADRLWISQ
ncbi:MAG TPA: ABC transporter substrate-binding protein [Mesorhizobium sp.]|uniref:ABC transporter substrate-binding protein n=1 Tax=Mesorhizobium sp. TaxID=1871066 RepID=UPI002DDCED95|nr:ABC transporter substrate-binding protein [Mesorhizobium sp.]HEV2501659.1 ABC transporter substrate-binding protein [Mesorhizobium sp.]